MKPREQIQNNLFSFYEYVRRQLYRDSIYDIIREKGFENELVDLKKGYINTYVFLYL
jgi:hypothetical protein